MTRNHTRKQHLVPQMYLRNWTASGGLYVADRHNGRVLPNQSTENFAQEHDFYGFIDLDPNELICLVEWTYMSFPPHRVRLIDAMLAVMVLHVLRLRVENQDWSLDYENSFERVRPKLLLSDEQDLAYQLFLSRIKMHIAVSQKEKDGLNKITENGFEDFHSAIENGAKIVLDIVKRGDLSFLVSDRQKTMYLLIYLFDQFFRSRKYLKLIEDNRAEILRKVGASSKLVRCFRYFLPVLYYSRAIHLKDGRKMVTVRNESGVEYITSDSPVVLCGGLHEDLPALMYFPLSPKVALLYGVKKTINKIISKVGREIHDEKVVLHMNQCVANECERFIFGSSRQALELLQLPTHGSVAVG